MAITVFKWLYLLAFNLLHPVYVSVTEIIHNSDDKTLEISCKIFADDFENVLTKKNKTAISLSKPKDKAALDNLIAQYLGEHLSLRSDGKTVSLFYLGFEIEEDAVYCYLQANDIATVKKVEAFNTMLHDLNDKQANIMHMTVKGNRKSTKLDFPVSQATFQF
jgi:hypothetical protein